jgi:hypothetical protein
VTLPRASSRERSALPSPVGQPRQRFTHGVTCPVCGGCDNAPRGQGIRCPGFIQGDWIYCTREEKGAGCKHHPNTEPPTWSHRLRGKCPCGVEHNPDLAIRKPGVRKSDGRKFEDQYDYPDKGGKLLYVKKRWRLSSGEKTFSYHHPGPDGRLLPGLGGRKPVLYNLLAIAAAAPGTVVYIVEGEKDVNRLKKEEKLATCNPEGASKAPTDGRQAKCKWLDRYSDELVGFHCLVIQDNDQTGRDHAQGIARSLHGKAASVRILDLVKLMPDLPEKGDVSDFLNQGGTLDQLNELERATAEWTAPAAGEQPKPEPKEDQSHAGILKRIAATAKLFKTPAGDGYATIKVNGREEHHLVESRAMEDWLTYEFMEQVDRAPSSESLSQIVSTIKARARFSRVEIPVGIRVAPDLVVRDPLAPVYYLDLNNEKGQAIRISAAGWSIVDDPLVKFRRPKGMGRLPVPERGGSLEILREFVNIEDNDWILFIGGLTHDFLPVAPQPIKVMAGEQGSCKSTTTEVMKRCVDPYRPMLGSPPADIRDLVIIANNTWVVAFDNLSTIRPWLSDAICRLAYGTGFQTRTLCTNDELTTFESCRPIIVNGIDDLVTRHDLLSRALVLNCPTFNEDNRRADDEFWLAFERAHPRILGALLDAIVGGLGRLPTLGKIKLPRMATFARWGEAVSQHLGSESGKFLAAFLGNQQSASAELLEDSPLVSELMSLGLGMQSWEGSSQQFLMELESRASAAIRAHAKWPRGSRSLSCALRRLAPGLRKQGIDVQFAPRLDRSRLIRVVWSSTKAPPSVASFASFASFASEDSNGKATNELPQSQRQTRVPF